VEILKEIYDTAVSFPGITGLMIGTRPDCINDDVLKLIESYNKNNFELWIELGMQSLHDKSLKLLNRRHNSRCTINALKRIAEYNIKTCVHVILGIPGETWNDMMETAEVISALPVNGVKLHHLHIIKNTPLEKIALGKNYRMIAFKEYISTVCDFIERLRPDILIHRLAGDRSEDTLIEPKWGLHKGTVLQGIEDEFKKRCTWQGFLY
jgi:radical SAM protein (TIGR01212 family)